MACLNCIGQNWPTQRLSVALAAWRPPLSWGWHPLYRAGLVNGAIPLVVDAKVGSSAAGATAGAGSHHPDRSGAVRSFQPTGPPPYRRTHPGTWDGRGSAGGELHQDIAFSATAVELVRGVLVTAHVFLNVRTSG